MNANDSSITMLRLFCPMITFQKTCSGQKHHPGPVKAKTFNEDSAFCLTSLRSTSSSSSAADGLKRSSNLSLQPVASAAVSHEWHKRHTETTWHSTLRQLLWRKDWKLRLFCHWAIAVRGNRQFPANLQEFHVRESRPCSLLSETGQKYVEKPMHCLRLHVSVKGAVVRTPLPSTTNSRESASETKLWLFSDGNWPNGYVPW